MKHFSKFLSDFPDVLKTAAIFPVAGKQPVKGLQWRACVKQGAGVYGEDSQWRASTGYAVAPVLVKYPLAILDLDQPEHPACQRVLELVGKTLRVEARGVHLYVRLPYLLANYALKDAEGREVLSLRGVGRYVVGPGSHHPDPSVGLYRVTVAVPPRLLSAAVTKALHAILAGNGKGSQMQGRRVNPRLVTEILRRLEAWQGAPLRYRANGTADLFRNPMRDDDEHRSAFVSTVTGMIFDMGTGKRWTTAEVANFLGIRFKDLGGLFEE